MSIKLFIEAIVKFIFGVLIIGLLMSLIIKKLKLNTVVNVILLLGLSFGMVALEEIIKQAPKKLIR